MIKKIIYYIPTGTIIKLTCVIIYILTKGQCSCCNLYHTSGFHTKESLKNADKILILICFFNYFFK